MTTSPTPSPTDKPLILPFQQPIFDRLCAVARACLYVGQYKVEGVNFSGCAVARACLYVDRCQFSALKFRACFWLIGRTGSGKTFLASALAREMQVPYLTVAISDWMILGGTHKGGAATWPVIFQFIEQSMNARGAIIFIDELDKCGDSSNYNSFLRSEVFSLCDARVPLGILDTDGDFIPKSRIENVREYLTNKTLIIGGAAFQGIWESLSRPVLGFNSSPHSSSLPELPDLAQTLPRELINRFSSEMFTLPEVSELDYRMMVDHMAEHVPETWRKRFLELGLSGIEQAMRHQKGARFLEETLLTAVVEERAALTNFIPDPMVTPELEKPDKDLDLRVF